MELDYNEYGVLDLDTQELISHAVDNLFDELSELTEDATNVDLLLLESEVVGNIVCAVGEMRLKRSVAKRRKCHLASLRQKLKGSFM